MHPYDSVAAIIAPYYLRDEDEYNDPFPSLMDVATRLDGNTEILEIIVTAAWDLHQECLYEGHYSDLNHELHLEEVKARRTALFTPGQHFWLNHSGWQLVKVTAYKDDHVHYTHVGGYFDGYTSDEYAGHIEDMMGRKEAYKTKRTSVRPLPDWVRYELMTI